jgi:hypothetical protein
MTIAEIAKYLVGELAHPDGYLCRWPQLVARLLPGAEILIVTASIHENLSAMGTLHCGYVNNWT